MRAKREMAKAKESATRRKVDFTFGGVDSTW